MNSAQTLLSVRNLSLKIPSRRGIVHVLDEVSLDVPRGKTIGLVGESGSGKSMLARSILRILPSSVELSGSIALDGQELLPLTEPEMRKLRGQRIAMIFQDPMSSLNPVRKIGVQVIEGMCAHSGASKRGAMRSARSLLESLGIPDAQNQLHRYPGELSGGMRQRIAIAIALACEPDILIADEPTTALDVTVQAQILQLLQSEQRRRGMSILLITHDLGVVSQYTDEVAVIYAGRIVETLPDTRLLSRAKMPYTQALLRCQPDLTSPSHQRLETIPGLPPSLTMLPAGCRFAARCSRRQPDCEVRLPVLVDGRIPGHRFACWHPSQTGDDD